MTGIIEAASLGDIGLIASLLKTKSIETQDDQGNTPLMMAAKHNQSDAVQFLLDQGANTSKKNDDGYTALNIAMYHECKDACIAFGKYMRDTQDISNIFDQETVNAINEDHLYSLLVMRRDPTGIVIKEFLSPKEKNNFSLVSNTCPDEETRMGQLRAQ
ncbi:MAG: ankyrin repeat domain-containing protein [Rickettsiaceae bacterium]|nr:ankyrin repeat domain-containing protein [Rickettsiaceae bacterium]